MRCLVCGKCAKNGLFCEKCNPPREERGPDYIGVALGLILALAFLASQVFASWHFGWGR